MPEAESVAIGRLRWPVYIATRAQLAQVDDTGIDEILCDMQLVKADIQPVGALTFWGQAGEQIDGPITHRIFIRWLEYLRNDQVVLRRTEMRNGRFRFERFRVRRVREIGGRKRFVILEAELEQVED